MERLLSKLDRMRDALGDRVFDVVGEVLSLNGVNLPEMLREAAYEPRRLDDCLDAIERIDPKQLELYEDATGIALARAHVDFSSFAQANLEAEERRLMPRYVESYFLDAARVVGLQTEARAGGRGGSNMCALTCAPNASPRSGAWSASRSSSTPP